MSGMTTTQDAAAPDSSSNLPQLPSGASELLLAGRPGSLRPLQPGQGRLYQRKRLAKAVAARKRRNKKKWNTLADIEAAVPGPLPPMTVLEATPMDDDDDTNDDGRPGPSREPVATPPDGKHTLRVQELINMASRTLHQHRGPQNQDGKQEGHKGQQEQEHESPVTASVLLVSPVPRHPPASMQAPFMAHLVNGSSDEMAASPNGGGHEGGGSGSAEDFSSISASTVIALASKKSRGRHSDSSDTPSIYILAPTSPCRRHMDSTEDEFVDDVVSFVTCH